MNALSTRGEGTVLVAELASLLKLGLSRGTVCFAYVYSTCSGRRAASGRGRSRREGKRLVRSQQLRYSYGEVVVSTAEDSKPASMRVEVTRRRKSESSSAALSW